MSFKILFRGLSKLTFSLQGKLPSVDVDRHHDGSPSKFAPYPASYSNKVRSFLGSLELQFLSSFA